MTAFSTTFVSSPAGNVHILLVSDLHYTLRQFDWVVDAAPGFDLAALVQLLIAWLRIVLAPFRAPNVPHGRFICKFTYPTFACRKGG